MPTIASVQKLTDGPIAGNAAPPRRQLGVRWKKPVLEFIDENGGGPGVRLRKRQRAKSSK